MPHPMIYRRRISLTAAIAVVGLVALLLAGCSVGAGSASGQPSALPTFSLPILSTTQPSHNTTTLAGLGAIKPHLSGAPAFTANDMTQYLNAHPLTAPDAGAGQPTVLSVGFPTCAEIDAKIGSPVSQMLAGCFEGAIYGLVIESGTFAFAGADGGSHSDAQGAFAIFDATSGNLVLFGSVASQTATPGSTPSPTPNPAQSPTATQPPTKSSPTPTPHVALVLKPQSAEQNCLLSSTTLTAISLTLDNSGSNVSVSWNATISETVGTSSVIWAIAAPSSGTIPAGATAHVSVTPDSALCTNSQSVVPDATYHVVFHYGSGQQLTFSDLVHSPVPG